MGPAPISRELSSIGAGSALRYEILEWIMEIRLRRICLPAEGSECEEGDGEGGRFFWGLILALCGIIVAKRRI